MPPEQVQFPNPVRIGDDFELDARAYELRRAGRPLKLERIPMELLLFPEQPRFIQTVTGRGYRFIAPVVEIVPNDLFAADELPMVLNQQPTTTAISPSTWTTRWWILSVPPRNSRNWNGV